MRPGTFLYFFFFEQLFTTLSKVEPPLSLADAQSLSEDMNPLEYCGIKISLRNSPNSFHVLIPSPLHVALNNLKIPPDQNTKYLDPNQWDWTRENYKYSDMNSLALITYFNAVLKRNARLMGDTWSDVTSVMSYDPCLYVSDLTF